MDERLKKLNCRERIERSEMQGSEMQGQKRKMKGSEMKAEREREREREREYVNIYRVNMLTYIEGLC